MIRSSPRRTARRLCLTATLHHAGRPTRLALCPHLIWNYLSLFRFNHTHSLVLPILTIGTYTITAAAVHSLIWSMMGANINSCMGTSYQMVNFGYSEDGHTSPINLCWAAGCLAMIVKLISY